MRFQILGPLSIEHDGAQVAITPPKERALLVRFLLDAGRAVSVERLVEDLWEQPPENAIIALRIYVSRIRKALGAPQLLATVAGGYKLELGSDEDLDLRRFESLVANGRRAFEAGAPASAAEFLGEALSLVNGEPLTDVIDLSFARTAAARIEATIIAVIEQKAEADLACGRHEQLCEDLIELTHTYPYRERLWHTRLLALYRCGRQADALELYRHVQKLFAEELGIDPSPELGRLHGAILTHARELDLAPPAAPVLPSPRAPRGEVTFLLTDMESSTRLWQRDPRAMFEADARLRELIGEAAERCGGYLPLEQGEGDSAVLVFDEGAAAVACAVDLQRAILAEAWPGGLSLRLRMGLHTGETEIGAGSYRGIAIIRAARLRDAAHGGQILCSIETAERAGAALGTITFEELGSVRLKDLSSAVRVVQVTHPDLPATFPALRTLDGRPNNLPAQLTGFIERITDLGLVRDALMRARLVTLVGTGGCGKTRIALQVAASLLDGYRDGVWFVDLAPLSDPRLVIDAVASALGVLAPAGGTIDEAVHEYLRSREALIILDNCEHLVEAAAGSAHRLLNEASAVRIIATSREALRVPGEALRQIGPMAVPDPGVRDLEELSTNESVQLFCQRGVLADGSFTLDDSTVSDVVEICTRLDGIPLAIELAASRLSVSSPAEIVKGLGDRFSLLDAGPRTVLPRQQTLRAMVEWSVQLMSPVEIDVFVRASVFAGGFSETSARLVCDTDDVAVVLRRLVSASLITRAGDGRFGMLETLREYGRELLRARGEEDATRRRHFAHFAELAHHASQHLNREEQGDWLVALECEHDNLRAAMAWALSCDVAGAASLADDLFLFWETRGYDTEGVGWFELILRGDLGPLARAKSLCQAGQLLWRQGDVAAASVRTEEALAIYRQNEDDHGIAKALSGLAIIAHVQGDANAISLYEESLTFARSSGQRDAVAVELSHLGIWYVEQGDIERARPFFEEALEIEREFGDKRVIASSLEGLANIASQVGDFETAHARFDETLAVVREIGGDAHLGFVLYNLALLAMREGKPSEARAHIEESVTLMRRMGDKRGLAYALGVSGDVARAGGDHAGAVALYEEAIPEFKGMGDRVPLVQTWLNIAMTWLDAGQVEAAHASLIGTLAEITSQTDSSTRGFALHCFARLAVLGGAADLGAVLLGASEGILTTTGTALDPSDAAQNLEVCAQARAIIGDAAFEEAFARGRAMDANEAMRLTATADATRFMTLIGGEP